MYIIYEKVQKHLGLFLPLSFPKQTQHLIPNIIIMSYMIIYPCLRWGQRYLYEHYYSTQEIIDNHC